MNNGKTVVVDESSKGTMAGLSLATGIPRTYYPTSSKFPTFFSTANFESTSNLTESLQQERMSEDEERPDAGRIDLILKNQGEKASLLPGKWINDEDGTVIQIDESLRVTYGILFFSWWSFFWWGI